MRNPAKGIYKPDPEELICQAIPKELARIHKKVQE